MTLPDDRIGDKGQRFQVEGRTRESGEWETVGWTEDPTGGCLVSGARKWPRYDDVRVVDRTPNPPESDNGRK